MKKTTFLISIAILFVMANALVIQGCATHATIAGKSGAQLWGENCQRCHNTPPPDSYKNEHWEVVGTHMKIRANLTDMETEKIVEFLKTAN